jgi:hypothetical protein
MLVIGWHYVWELFIRGRLQSGVTQLEVSENFQPVETKS